MTHARIRLVVPFLVGSLVAMLAASAFAQNRRHPGLVHLGKDTWGTPAEASAKGLIEYEGRWLPKKYKRQLAKWERLDKKVGSWDDAFRSKSKHYRIQTNAPNWILELELKPFLDELFRTYVQTFKEDFGLASKAANKNFIKIYWGFEAYHVHEDEDRYTPGFFQGDELVVFYDPTDPAEFYNTVFHEGAHQFFVATLPAAELPIWLDEALAVYFEGCSFSRATGKVTRNHVPSDRLFSAQEQLREAKRAGASLSAHDLFMRFEGDDFGAEHYALAWSFVHYLIHRDGGKRKKAFAKFLDAMNGAGAKPIADVFKKATRESLAEVEAGWVDWVMALEAEEEPEWIVLGVGGAADGEDVKSGDLLWSLDGVEVFAEAQFDELWAKRPQDRAYELVLVRRTPPEGARAYRQEFVKVTVQPGSKLELRAADLEVRLPNLVD